MGTSPNGNNGGSNSGNGGNSGSNAGSAWGQYSFADLQRMASQAQQALTNPRLNGFNRVIQQASLNNIQQEINRRGPEQAAQQTSQQAAAAEAARQAEAARIAEQQRQQRIQAETAQRQSLQQQLGSTDSIEATGVGNSQGGNVVFTTAPANGLEVLIKRATPYTRQTDYADNGDLLADVVNDDFDRIWLALQEINASFSSSISKPVGGNWDAQGLRLTGLADGSQPQDAVTYNQLFTVNGSAGQSATAAAGSATVAKNSESNAASSQQAAASSASAASVSAGNSSDSANLAQNWAANPVGTEVTGGKFSALHYASKASDSAASASNSAANASTSATNASNSAGAAAQSATSAKSDADRAQSANPENQLKKASNLSDVADKAAAWANIVKFGTDASSAAVGNDPRILDSFKGADVTGTPWSQLTLTGGWSVAGRAVFRKILGLTFIDLHAAGGNTGDGTILATLPTGYRPPASIHAVPFAVGASANIPPRLVISNDGTIRIYNTGGNADMHLTINFCIQ
ncbi:hypothetical protein A8L51_06015 [Pantoea stewartii]|nr:hypothetical protein [Pantoea stewartii]